VDAAGTLAARRGQPLPTTAPDGTLVRLLTTDGTLAAIAEARDGRLVYHRGFNYGLTEPDR